MALTRYLVTLDTEDGPFMTSPLGGVITFDHYEDAKVAATRQAPGRKRWIHNTLPLAVYDGKGETATAFDSTNYREGDTSVS